MMRRRLDMFVDIRRQEKS